MSAIARTKAAVQQRLTGPAIRQYNQMFALVEQQAPKEKVVVTTRLTNIGVELLTAWHARLLVFRQPAGLLGRRQHGAGRSRTSTPSPGRRALPTANRDRALSGPIPVFASCGF